MDSTHDLRIQYRVPSVRHLLDLQTVKTHERTLNLTYHGFANFEQLKNSLFERLVLL